MTLEALLREERVEQNNCYFASVGRFLDASDGGGVVILVWDFYMDERYQTETIAYLYVVLLRKTIIDKTQETKTQKMLT